MKFESKDSIGDAFYCRACVVCRSFQCRKYSSRGKVEAHATVFEMSTLVCCVQLILMHFNETRRKRMAPSNDARVSAGRCASDVCVGRFRENPQITV